MDQVVRRQWQDRAARGGAGDFRSLFAELDQPDASAPIDIGLHRLLGAIETLRRTPPDRR